MGPENEWIQQRTLLFWGDGTPQDIFVQIDQPWVQVSNNNSCQAANLPDYIRLPKSFVDWTPIVVVIRFVCLVMELSRIP